jgi:hypothetical protein
MLTFSVGQQDRRWQEEEEAHIRRTPQEEEGAHGPEEAWRGGVHFRRGIDGMMDEKISLFHVQRMHLQAFVSGYRTP